MPLIFPIVYSLWLLSEILLNRFLRAKKTDKQNTDKGSMAIIWITIIFSNVSAAIISNWHPLPLSENSLIRYVGLSLIIIGMIFRFIIISNLGKFFTVDVTIKDNHKLKTDGFYKYVRHPSYFASLISFVGFGVTLNNWISLALVFSLTLFAFLFRIRIEEKALLEHFGSEYVDYKKRTKTIIPLLY